MSKENKQEKKTPENQQEETKEESKTAEMEDRQMEASEKEASPAPNDELQKKYDELYNKYLLTLAEYDNYKKRTQKEKDELYAYAVADTVGKLLPVVDNLERAVDTAEEKSPFVEGVKMILKQLFEIFEKMDISEIEAVDKEFDPNLHNAVMHVEDESAAQNIVVEQFMKGYKHKDKVIRHSMVKVAN